MTTGKTASAQQTQGAGRASYINGAPGFEMSRVFNAPRDLVYQAWTQAEHLKQWWGPKGCTIPRCTLDLRVGGAFHYCLRFPDGREMWGKWIFDEVNPPERLAFTSVFSDVDGNTVSNPWRPEWPREAPGLLTFEDQGGKTRLTMQVFLDHASETERAAFEAGRKGFHQGCSGTWDQLEEYLAKQ